MADLCSIVGKQPVGLNQECLEALAAVEGIGLSATKSTFTATTVLAKSTWKPLVDTALTLYVANLKGYVPTDGEVQTSQSEFGVPNIDQETPSSGIFHLESSPCDFRELLTTVRGGTYGVPLFLKDGTIMLWKDSNETYRFFDAQVIAPAPGLPTIDNRHMSYKLHVYFKNVRQFRKFVIVKPTWDVLDDLILATPNGLSLSLTTHDNDDPVVQVNERCQDGFTGLTYDDFEIVNQSGSRAFQVTAFSDDGGGAYTLDLDSALAAVGDFVEFRVKDGSGPYDNVSGILRLEYIAP